MQNIMIFGTSKQLFVKTFGVQDKQTQKMYIVVCRTKLCNCCSAFFFFVGNVIHKTLIRALKFTSKFSTEPQTSPHYTDQNAAPIENI